MEKVELLDLLYKLLTEQISEEEQGMLFSLFDEYLNIESTGLANFFHNF